MLAYPGQAQPPEVFHVACRQPYRYLQGQCIQCTGLAGWLAARCVRVGCVCGVVVVLGVSVCVCWVSVCVCVCVCVLVGVVCVYVCVRECVCFGV